MSGAGPNLGAPPSVSPLPASAGRWLAVIEDGAVFIASMLLAFCMIVCTLDALLRYMFNSPLGWVYDLGAGFLIPLMFFLALAQTMRYGEHIRVDFFLNLMNARTRRLLLAIGILLSLMVFVLVSYISSKEAIASFMAGETVIGYHVWPIWIPKAGVAVGFILLTLRLAVLLFVQPRADDRA